MVRKVRTRLEIWVRTAAISSVHVSLGCHANQLRGSEPERETIGSLQLRGLLEEGVRDVREVEFHLYPADEVRVGTARPAAVGAIIGFRPYLQVVVSFNQQDFDRLWAMALNGYLRHAYLAFTKPRYTKALVTSVSFSTEPEE
jgi:hypothetical protein